MKKLKRLYFQFITPAVLLTAGVFLLQEYKIWKGFDILPSRTLSITIFVLAVAIGVALPIFTRVWFFGKLKEKKFFSEEEFYAYESFVIKMISLTPYLALIAALLKLPNFYFAGTSLAALYAIYYNYPSEKKIQFDQKIFKVKNDADID